MNKRQLLYLVYEYQDGTVTYSKVRAEILNAYHHNKTITYDEYTELIQELSREVT